MAFNIFSAAALTAVSKLRDSSANNDDKILELRRNGFKSEVYGEISLVSEESGPTTDNVYFMEEIGVRIETNGYDYVTKHYNRSCNPNCGLRPLYGRKALFGAFIYKTHLVEKGEQLTLPFNKGWEFSDQRLFCGLHPDGDCPLEKKRYILAEIRYKLGHIHPEKLEELYESVQKLKAEMDRTGQNSGKIVVSGKLNEISIAMGKMKIEISKAVETPKVVSVDAATQTDSEATEELTPEQYSSYF